MVVLDNGQVIAEGTPSDLQGRIGGQTLEVETDTDSLEIAAAALEQAGLEPRTDRGRGRVTSATTKGLDAVAAATGALQSVGCRPNRVTLRHSTLEEAFLHLTGTRTLDSPRHDEDTSASKSLPERDRPATTRSTRRQVSRLVGRDLQRLARTPELVFFAVAMPVMFVLGLVAVFGDLVEACSGRTTSSSSFQAYS